MIKAILSMMSPRLELDFVESWLNHHRKAGFERFYIFSTDHEISDQRFMESPDKRVWGKKPWANYHLDLSNETIDELWNELVDCDDAVHQRIQLLDQGTGPTQKALLHNHFFEIVPDEVEWVAHIDGDELICGDLNWLNTLPSEVAAVHLPQLVLPERWKDGKSTPYREIHHYLGKLHYQPKCIARRIQLENWSGVHCIKKSDTKSGITYSVRQTSDKLLVHHFRGWKSCMGSNGQSKATQYLKFKHAKPLPLQRGHFVARASRNHQAGLSRKEREALEGYLNLASAYLEWGTGQSTELAALKGVSTTTVDSDPHYTHLAKQLKKVDARHIDIGAVNKWGYPKYPASIEVARQYVHVDNVNPTIVLVDGRFRVACALFCLEKFPDATIAIHNFWYRRHYHEVLKYGRIIKAVDNLVFLRRRSDVRVGLETVEQFLHDPR